MYLEHSCLVAESGFEPKPFDSSSVSIVFNLIFQMAKEVKGFYIDR